MGAPHNPARYGEKWPQERIDATLREMEPLRTFLVVSGGWAWHFMSPPEHIEYKHLHDHKDVDVFVHPNEASMLHVTMRKRGFVSVHTRYDRPGGKFVRFEKAVSPADTPFKITIDMFVGNPPIRVVRDGLWRVVEPEHLLSPYDSVHSSSECFAVLAARYLIERRIDPVGHSKLVEIPLYPKKDS